MSLVRGVILLEFLLPSASRGGLVKVGKGRSRVTKGGWLGSGKDMNAVSSETDIVKILYGK